MTESAPALRPAVKIASAAIALASLLLYAAGVLVLRQDLKPGWSLEAQGAIPAAISYLAYRTPLGAVDDNVVKAFLFPNGRSVQEILAAVADKSVEPGYLHPTTFDGIGAGTNLFATAAMWLFGPHILSLVLFYLLIVGVAAAVFVLRFRDKRLLVVPLYFFVVTIMLLTPLGTAVSAVDQAPIGGQRYFVLAAIIPALHIFFEITDRPAAVERRGLNGLLLFIQALLFGGALLVRSSVGYLALVIIAAWIWRLYRDRGYRQQWRRLWEKAGIGAAAVALWLAVVVTMLPAYVYSGRLFGNVWHRAFTSFTVHPDWPFGNLRQVYDCTPSIPEGLSQQNADRNGHCVWLAYPPNATRSSGDIVYGVYDGEYEKVLRQAYFYVLIHYPKQAFELYVFVKSALIGDVIVAAWHDLFSLAQAPAPAALFVIATVQLLAFIAFLIARAVVGGAIVDRQMAIFPVLFIASLAPLYAALANTATTVDFVFLMYSCLVLAALSIVQFLGGAFARAAPARPAVASLAPLYVAWASPWTSADTVVLFYACLALAVVLAVQLALTMLRLTPQSPPAGAWSPPGRRSR